MLCEARAFLVVHCHLVSVWHADLTHTCFCVLFMLHVLPAALLVEWLKLSTLTSLTHTFSYTRILLIHTFKPLTPCTFHSPQMEIHEVEERKNLHISILMENHEAAFKEFKEYYNAITQDNFALIRSLKVGH